MFENLGEKLMRVAKEIMLYGVVLSILAAIICFIGEELGIGLLLFIGGPICFSMLAVLLYWMGNVLVNQEEMIQRQREIVWVLRAQGEPEKKEQEKR